MSARLDYQKIAPAGVAALMGVSSYATKEVVDPKLRALIDLRVSQINGCPFCLNMHTQEARHAGEDQQRLDVLSAWRETSFFSDKERAALAWAEMLTQLPPEGIPDDAYAALAAQFNEKEIVDLTLVIVAINAWNRVSIGFRSSPLRRKPVLS